MVYASTSNNSILYSVTILIYHLIYHPQFDKPNLWRYVICEYLISNNIPTTIFPKLQSIHLTPATIHPKPHTRTFRDPPKRKVKATNKSWKLKEEIAWAQVWVTFSWMISKPLSWENAAIRNKYICNLSLY